jgi:hypothetical protein
MSNFTIREIKTQLDRMGVKYDGIVEKSELRELLDSARRSSLTMTVAMSVSALKEIIRSLAGRPGVCSEKVDLFNLAKELLGNRTCTICLERLLTTCADTIVRVPCCGAFLHTTCIAEWILRSTQDGIFPHKCPSCQTGDIPETFIIKNVISPEDTSGRYMGYITAVEGLKKLRALHESRTTITREEEQQLLAQGFRRCPQCGVWIEKGPSMEAFGIPIARGCDKMTCRCGCKFCFRCGSLNANCRCTGAEHGFFEHHEVLNQYPRSQLGAGDLLSNLL